MPFAPSATSVNEPSLQLIFWAAAPLEGFATATSTAVAEPLVLSIAQ